MFHMKFYTSFQASNKEELEKALDEYLRLKENNGKDEGDTEGEKEEKVKEEEKAKEEET